MLSIISTAATAPKMAVTANQRTLTFFCIEPVLSGKFGSQKIKKGVRLGPRHKKTGPAKGVRGMAENSPWGYPQRQPQKSSIIRTGRTP